MITDTNIPNPEDFGFTEILDDTLPYKIVGYARGVCPDADNPYGYAPPVGWKITSCTAMPPGSHGVPTGKPTILVYCEPVVSSTNIPPADYDQSIIYPVPTDRIVVTGHAYSVPGYNAFYIEQLNFIRYSVSGMSLGTLGYQEGESVVAALKLPAGYLNSIGADKWGYTAELLDIRREGEAETQSEIDVNTNTENKIPIDPWLILAIGGGIVGLGLGLYSICREHKRP